MPVRPLLKLPDPIPFYPRARGGGGARIARPSRDRQRERIDPKFEALTRVAEQPEQILALRADPASIAPERAIVFEVEGSLEDFYAQARDIGLEYLGDYEDDFEPSPDYYDQKHPEKMISGRIYLAMPSVQAIQELLSLWARYKSSQRMPNGKAQWTELFKRLIDVRPWGPQDRIPPEAITGFREDLERNPDSPQPVEIEFWFHENEAARTSAFQKVQREIVALGGRVIDHVVIPEICYDAALVEIPARHVETLIGNRNVSLAQSDEVMFLRPQSVSKFDFKEEDSGSDGEPGAAVELADNLPIAALLDGLPVQNHIRLANRLIVDDPEGLDENYPVSQREHGTGMASLIIHGDLNRGEQPLPRPLYVRPVMQPTPSGERTPAERLLVDVIYQAVRRMKIGDGDEPAAAPSVVVVNLSIADDRRPFARVMSPLGRLLDYLSNQYKVLFLVSAGNILDRLPVPPFRTSAEFAAATPEERESAILSALNAHKSVRTLYSPAESVNSLTIGGAHAGSAFTGVLPADWYDPFTDGSLPNITSAMGLGFRKVIKLDLLFDGGRTPVSVVAAGDDLVIAPLRGGARHFGLKAAQPSAIGGTRHEDFTWGTSVATALGTRAAHQIYDTIVDADGGSNHADTDSAYMPLILKALLVHGASWGPKGDMLDQTFGPRGQGGYVARRDDITRLLGYGVPQIERVLDCAQNQATLLGYGSIRPEEGLLYRIPLPSGLDGVRAYRAMTVTLAWMSPVNPRHQGYRMAALDVSSASEDKYWIAPDRACQPSDKSVARGTVFHEKRAGDLATVFNDDGYLLLRVSCRATAGLFDEAVPYALAVSFEVGVDAGIDVYEEVREALTLPVPAAVRLNA